MIISRQKDSESILGSLEDQDSIFLVGCAACATACKAGGEEEVFRIEEFLASEGKEITGSVVIEETCHIMRAGRDLRQHKAQVREADAILVLACGAGIQSISENTDQRVIGGLDSLFLGNIRRFGQYEERCSLCGDCILNDTAGICPVTTCAKGLLNGPCGGMEEGKCEADHDVDCAWHLIYERLKKQGRPGIFGRTVQPKEWGRNHKPRRHRINR
ncbi:MAG: methylenetetrahydrofolate reductase C-terminal domain-containing protein [Desulfuromonadales bacterium]